MDHLFKVLACIGTASALLLAMTLSGCGGETSGEPPTETWQYVALGNSLAVGVLAERGYVPRYQQHIQADTGRTVVLTNLGVNGWQSADLLAALRGDARFRNAIRQAQVVTWEIGGNDLRAVRLDFIRGTCGGADGEDCLRRAVAQFKTNWDAIVAEILALRGGNPAILRTMDIYNPFVALDRLGGRFAVLNPYLREVNAYIAVSAQRNNIPCARVHQAFNGEGDEDPVIKGLVSSDGLHPNDRGHEVIAAAFRALGYAPFQ
jgi:lysophospholipase L1-like esterase